MKKTVLLSLSLITFISGRSQDVAWVVSTPTLIQPGKLVCDPDDNVYCYGNYNGKVEFATDPSTNYYHFSTVSKYRPDGSLMFTEDFRDSLMINHMISDATGNMYFTGVLWGETNIKGKSIRSAGGYDGVVGKFDPNGEPLWISTFGGAGNDMGNALTLSHDGRGVMLTGGVASQLFYNGKAVSTFHQNDLLLMQVDANGELVAHKTFDFEPANKNGSIGRELVTSVTGDYFMLAHREGTSWVDTNQSKLKEGEYMYKLNAHLDVIWEKEVITPSCYYGYMCGALGTANGDAYVSRYCSSKYGGTGEFMRLNGADGTSIWSRKNADGAYRASCSDVRAVHYVGIEDAIGCPCQASDPGYAVVKRVDLSNNDMTDLKVRYAHFFSIVKSRGGMTFVLGHANADTVKIGSKHVKRGNYIFAMGNLSTGIRASHIADKFNIFPNPSDGTFSIEIGSTAVTAMQLRIYTIVGELVFSSLEPVKSSERISVDLHALPSGTYFAELSSGGTREVKKFVIR